MLKICIILINFYQQYLSFDRGIFSILTPGGACKFDPSCSEYTKQALANYGILAGTKLAVLRILKCK